MRDDLLLYYERELTYLREMGDITGGPAPYAPRDRSRFLQHLDDLIQAGLKQVAQGLLQGGGASGAGGVVGGMLGVQKVFVVNMGAGGMGGGPGGVMSETTGGGILSTLKTGLAVTIAAVSIYELVQQIGTFMQGVGQSQGSLQAQVDATKTQTANQAAANLGATVGNLNGMNLAQRAIALTFGGGQITQDFVTAATNLTNATLSSADATKDLPSLQAALDLAQYEHLTAAIGPLKTAIAKLGDEVAGKTTPVPGGMVSGGITGQDKYPVQATATGTANAKSVAGKFG